MDMYKMWALVKNRLFMSLLWYEIPRTRGGITMKIAPDYIGHDTPYGQLTVISPKRFTYLEGVEFLTKERIQKHIDIFNPKMAKHWYIPDATGVVLPIRKKDHHPFFIEKSLVNGPHWACGYRFEVDWDRESQALMEYGGIDISLLYNLGEKAKIELEDDD